MGGDKGEWSKFPQLNGPKNHPHTSIECLCVCWGWGGVGVDGRGLVSRGNSEFASLISFLIGACFQAVCIIK